MIFLIAVHDFLLQEIMADRDTVSQKMDRFASAFLVGLTAAFNKAFSSTERIVWVIAVAILVISLTFLVTLRLLVNKKGKSSQLPSLISHSNFLARLRYTSIERNNELAIG